MIPSGPVITYPPPDLKNPLVRASLNWNEYIVYKEAQVKMRYLVQVGPLPKKKNKFPAMDM